MKQAFYECPRFDICSVNDCPLSSIKYKNVNGDAETVCKARKSIRMKIASKYNLKNRGLTDSEIKKEIRKRKAKERYANLPPERKKRIAEVLKKGRQQRILNLNKPINKN